MMRRCTLRDDAWETPRSNVADSSMPRFTARDEMWRSPGCCVLKSDSQRLTLRDWTLLLPGWSVAPCGVQRSTIRFGVFHDRKRDVARSFVKRLVIRCTASHPPRLFVVRRRLNRLSVLERSLSRPTRIVVLPRKEGLDVSRMVLCNNKRRYFYYLSQPTSHPEHPAPCEGSHTEEEHSRIAAKYFQNSGNKITPSRVKSAIGSNEQKSPEYSSNLRRTRHAFFTSYPSPLTLYPSPFTLHPSRHMKAIITIHTKTGVSS